MNGTIAFVLFVIVFQLNQDFITTTLISTKNRYCALYIIAPKVAIKEIAVITSSPS